MSWQNTAVNWWQQKTGREKVFLSVGFLVVAYVVVQYGYLKPVQNAIAKQRALAQEQQVDYAWMQMAVPPLEQVRKKPTHATQTKTTMADVEKSLLSLKEQGFPATLKQTRENTVDIDWKQVSFTEWMNWLKEVEDKGLGKIKILRIQSQPVPDLVAVQLQVESL